MKQSILLRTTALLVASLFVSSMMMDNADARDRQRQGGGSFVTGSGKSGSYQRSATGNRRDGLTRSQSVTGPNGNMHSRSATGSYDRATGDFNKTVTPGTGSGRSVTGNYNKETGAFTKTTTGADGKTITTTGTAVNGQRSGTYTTGDGKTGSFDSTLTRGDGTRSKTTNWTNQDGETKSRNATGSYDMDTGAINRSVTGPNGNTRDGSVIITPAAPETPAQ